MKYEYGEDSCNKCLINFLGVINLNKLVYIFVSKPHTFSYNWSEHRREPVDTGSSPVRLIDDSGEVR